MSANPQPPLPDPRAPDARSKRTKRLPLFTSTPDMAPPQLLCPTCDQPLVYRHTVIGGVKPTGVRPKFMPKIEDSGIQLPPSIFGLTGGFF